MKTKLELDTESIQNQSNITAKISHSKISSFHVTLKRDFVKGLGIDDGDKVDIAILKVHKNHGVPALNAPDVVSDVSTEPIENKTSDTANPQTPALEGSRQEGLQSMYRETPPAKKGGRGKSKRGKGVKSGNKSSKRSAHRNRK